MSWCLEDEGENHSSSRRRPRILHCRALHIASAQRQFQSIALNSFSMKCWQYNIKLFVPRILVHNLFARNILSSLVSQIWLGAVVCKTTNSWWPIVDRDNAACHLGDHRRPGALCPVFPGTLLPRLPSEPGMSLLTIKIQKIGLKDAGQCIDPYMTISVKGKLGFLCPLKVLKPRGQELFLPGKNNYWFSPVWNFSRAFQQSAADITRRKHRASWQSSSFIFPYRHGLFAYLCRLVPGV